MEEVKVEMKPEGLTMQIDIEAFALALKTYRLRNGLTQKQMGEKWGVSRYTIIRAESGKCISWQQAYRMFARLSKDLHEEKLNA